MGKAVFPGTTRCASGKLPGFVPRACNQRISWEQGRSIRFRRKPVGPDKLARRGRSDGLVEVRLADSTPRAGVPATWGSGQEKMNCSLETCALSKKRAGLVLHFAAPSHHTRTSMDESVSDSEALGSRGGRPDRD